MSLDLEHVDACLPITGLKALCLGQVDVVLQGHGPYSRLIHATSGNLLAEVRTFKRNNVHGFIVFPQTPRQSCTHSLQVLVWGGQSVRLVSIDWTGPAQHEVIVTLSSASAEYHGPDWLLSGCAVDGNEGRAFLVTAHNALLGVTLVEAVSLTYEKKIHIRHLATGVKSILYSADVVAISSDHILIAAGTVFGEIIVWSSFLAGDDANSCTAVSSIHHFFTGHEGSIFGVTISPNVALSGNATPCRLLASCSDDRTVRIWDISDCGVSSREDPSAYSTDGFELRSTGFGAVATKDLSDASCIAKAYGHGARIWGVRFLPLSLVNDESTLRLVSHGEDATCVFWELSRKQRGNGTLAFDLYELSSVHHHSGKHIWAIDIGTGGAATTIYTGGSDGALKTIQGSSAGGPTREYQGSNPLKPLSDHHTEHGSLTGCTTRALKSFAFVSCDCFLVVSFKGEVELGSAQYESRTDPTKHTQLSWERISVEEDLRTFSVMCGYPRKGVALIVNGQGLIRLYNHASRSLATIADAGERPLNIFALESMSTSEECLLFVVSFANTETAKLFIVDQWNGENRRPQSVTLALPHGFCISSAAFVLNEYSVLGSKLGALAVYKVEASNSALQPLYCMRRVHGIAGVNQIAPLATMSSGPGVHADYFMTCGRDGSYCVHELCIGTGCEEGTLIRTIHNSSPWSPPNIEGFYFDKTSQDLILYGFNDRKFVICNESTQTELMALECGGARRNWTFSAEETFASSGLFLWNQSSEFHALRTPTRSHSVLRAGGHGREIKSMAVFNSSKSKSTLIATGAEDTTVRIFAPTSSKSSGPWGSFKCLRILNKHRSGLQQLGWSSNGEYLFTCSGFEEFFVWNIRSIPRFGLASKLLAASPKDDEKSDLRVTSFDVVDVEGHGGLSGDFLICLVYSNSTLKIFHFSPSLDHGRFTLMAKGTYMANCLTQVKFVLKNSSISLITAATDGHLTFWNLTPVLSPFYDLTSSSGLILRQSLDKLEFGPESIFCDGRYQVHSNSIKSMEVVVVEEEDNEAGEVSVSKTIVICGGDDNALSVSVWRSVPDASASLSGQAVARALTTVSIPDAHAASVTAVKVIDSPTRRCSSEVLFTVASSGNDHRVKVWSVCVNTGSELDTDAADADESIVIRNLLDKYSSVADISSLDVIQAGSDETVCQESQGSTAPRLLVCGVGMELFEMKSG